MKHRLIRNSVFIGSVCLLSYGIIRGEIGTVLQKAVNICLECIGIG